MKFNPEAVPFPTTAVPTASKLAGVTVDGSAKNAACAANIRLLSVGVGRASRQCAYLSPLFSGDTSFTFCEMGHLAFQLI
ncbi:hypothetical protein AWB85_20295 [Mycobacteroides immunogenum]|uniref:Uncharacterized protein n=1 Tax=Mycobacteroides immunogenum TaxID=83262 RepID=A0A179VCH6_9MYCO|nr:hypothetical protein AWB85_20295 [Mycobacteroides immunogenum]